MKKITTFLFSLAIAGTSFATVINDTVHTNPNYTNDNYYRLSDLNQSTVDRSNWDIAFACDGLGGQAFNLRINGGIGTELYLFSNDTSDWSTLDTTGFNWSQNQLFNMDTSWSVGAFNSLTPQSGFDLGWGTYNMTTHHINGDRIFIVKLADATYRKLIVESLISGVYTFKYAPLTGGNTTTDMITKSNYTGKNFAYYSLQNGMALNREPDSEDWDLLFTKYVTMIAPNTPYAVTGVLANHSVKVAQVNNVADPYTESHIGPTYGHYINIIGSDWKSFNMSTFQFDIEDSLVYFVEDHNTHIYRIVFTGFTGQSAGEYHLDVEKVTGVGVEETIELDNNILNVFPNPAGNNVTVTFNASDNNSFISIIDITGKEVLTRNINQGKGLTQERFNVVDLKQGIYFIRITSGNKTSTEKLIIK